MWDVIKMKTGAGLGKLWPHRLDRILFAIIYYLYGAVAYMTSEPCDRGHKTGESSS